MSAYKVCRCPQIGSGHVCKTTTTNLTNIPSSKSMSAITNNASSKTYDSTQLSKSQSSALIALGNYYQIHEQRIRHQLQNYPETSHPAFWGFARDHFQANDQYPKYAYPPYMRSDFFPPHYHINPRSGRHELCDPFQPCQTTYCIS
uniref:Uncharacterized protein n=1 Tax=Ditylenchus dipsaci TaxID=166011 RepID=A0A915DVF2_9BILA